MADLVMLRVFYFRKLSFFSSLKKSPLILALVHVHDGRQFYVFVEVAGSSWRNSNGNDAQDHD